MPFFPDPMQILLKAVAVAVVGALSVLFDLLQATVFVSPDVTALPQVKTFAGTSLGVVNTAYVLAILWMAILVMSRETIQTRYGPGELIPRLVIGLIAANMAMPICSALIQLANAITAALTRQDITAPGSMRHVHNIVTAGLTNPTDTANTLMLIIALIIAVLAGVMVVQWIIRLGILVVAVSIAPIALALHGTPQTEGAAKLWWRTMLGTLGTVVIQAVALHTTLTVFLSPSANLPAVGLPGDRGTTMNLLIVLCLLLGIVKVPGLMRRYVTQTKPSTAGMILRVVLIQQLSHGIRRGLSATRGVATRGGSRPGNPGWPFRP